MFVVQAGRREQQLGHVLQQFLRRGLGAGCRVVLVLGSFLQCSSLAGHVVLGNALTGHVVLGNVLTCHVVLGDVIVGVRQ